jgi:hypothetical protein
MAECVILTGEVHPMSDSSSRVLAIFSERQRAYLRERAEEYESSVEEQLRELVEREMASEGDPLDNIVGMCHGDGSVTGENFHDYLYGRGRDD